MPMPQTTDPAKPGYVLAGIYSTTLPSGGTWLVYRLSIGSMNTLEGFNGSSFSIVSGGTTISIGWLHGNAAGAAFWAIRLT